MPIVITWPETTEYLDIDLDHLDADSIEKIEETKEWWPSTRDWYPGEGVFVYWRVECSLADGGNRITVKYTQGQQDDKHILKYNEQCEDSAQDSFGETSVFVKRHPESDRPRMVGTCYWNCENPDWSCRGRWKATGRPRSRVSREQWDRERGFRANVLAMDERCVLSGEETPEVLDAAHLRPVKEGGEELVENGFILRTDIHRLYDRGMFLINPKDGKFVVDRSLSKYYKQLFSQSQLQSKTLKRVREALEERWRKPRA